MQTDGGEAKMSELIRATIAAAALGLAVVAGSPAFAQKVEYGSARAMRRNDSPELPAKKVESTAEGAIRRGAIQSALPAESIESAAAQAIRRRDIQAELPQDKEETGWELRLPELDMTTWVLWFAIAFGVAAVLYPLRDQLLLGRLRRSKDWGTSGEGSAAGAPSSHLASASVNAEELARQGRYRDAIHLLLLHALNEMRQRLKAQFADSLTSREILRAAPLPAEGSLALRDMITQVERSYFGEYPVAADDYAACRASFDVFVLHLQAGGRR